MEDNRKMMQWVVSLAISVACCAVLFVVFAGALIDSQRAVISTQVKQDWLEARIYSLETTLNGMQQDMKAAKAEPAAPAVTILTPPPETPASVAPAVPASAVPAIETPVAPAAPATEAPVPPAAPASSGQ